MAKVKVAAVILVAVGVGAGAVALSQVAPGAARPAAEAKVVTATSPVTPAVISANGAELPSAIANALAWNASHVTPVEVSWTERGRFLLSDEDARSKLKMSQATLDAYRDTYNRRAIVQDANIYVWESFESVPLLPSQASRPATPVRKTFTRVASSDGKVRYMGTIFTPPRKETVVWVGKSPWSDVAATNPQGIFFNADYFWAAGFDMAIRAEDFVKKNSHRSQVLNLLDQGASVSSVKEAQVNGHNIVVVELTGPNVKRVKADKADIKQVEQKLREQELPEAAVANVLEQVRQSRQLPEQIVYSFQLDKDLNYAVRQSETHYPDGRILTQVTCDDFVNVPDRNVWLPRKCSRSMYQWEPMLTSVFKSPIKIDEFSVTEMKFGRVPDSQFVPPYDIPGARIVD